MSMTRMPDGTYVRIAPGTPPEVVARIRAQHPAPTTRPATAASRAPAANPRQTANDTRARQYAGQLQRDENRISGTLGMLAGASPIGMLRRAVPLARDFKEGFDESRNRGEGVGRALQTGTATAAAGHIRENTRNVRSGLQAVQSAAHEGSYHLDDVVTPALTAATAPDVWAGRRSLGDEYSAARQGARLNRERMADENPAAVAAGGLVGMLRAPLPKAITGGRITSPVGQAAAAGALQGGVTTMADTGDVGASLQSSLLGGGLGAGAGALFGKVLPGAVRAFKDRAPGEAERVAYDKIASVLGRSSDDAGQAFTPASAAAEVADASARGTPTSLGDLSPELANLRGDLVRRTGLKSASDAIARAEERIASAADRFNDKLRSVLPAAKGEDALKLTADINASRKAQASIDYAKGGPMDKTLKPTAHIIKILTKPTPDMADALAAARRAVANDPDLPKFGNNVRVGRGANARIVEVPTLRSFDEIKKSFDDIIESGVQHLPDGSTIVSNASRVASKQLRALKEAIAESNPEYGAILKRQRDAFERAESVEVGKSFIKDMTARPRELLENLKGRTAVNADEVRTGVIDALLSMRNSAGKPIVTLRRWERNPQQREVLEFVLGGSKNLNEFSKFMRREIRAAQADEAVMRGAKRPVTTDAAEAADSASRQTISDVFRGQVYGGPLGAVSAAGRALDRVRTGMGPEAQDATLRLLSGTGQGLESGVASAMAKREARRQAWLKRSQEAGRVSGATAASLNRRED